MTGNSSNKDHLYIVDNEYLSVVPQLREKAERVQQVWENYLETSERITGDRGSITGTRAYSYYEFVEAAKKHILKKPEETINETATDIDNYIDMIDQADSVLY